MNKRMQEVRPDETETQRQCREWWQAREPHVVRAWGRDALTGDFLAQSSKALHAAWVAAQGVK